MQLTVEWRTDGGTDAILVVDPDAGVSEVFIPDAVVMKDYLSVASDLGRWRQWSGWRPADGKEQDPDAWGELVIGRAATGDVVDVDPELYWEGIRRWFRAGRTGYTR